jgi:hypothetical protein
VSNIEGSDETPPEGPQVYSVSKNGRLVAYARRAVPEGGGAVQRASAKAPAVLQPISYGVVECFDAAAAKLIAERAKQVETLDALLFELKLEGFDVREGEAKPHGARWTF